MQSQESRIRFCALTARVKFALEKNKIPVIE